MSTLQDLEKEIENIKERNKRVEKEKAWETSWIRKFSIAFLTYIVVASFFYVMQFDHPLESAIIPSIAFILSTLSIPLIKKLWLNSK